MTELRRQDAEARARALDVTRSFIVQAPAGSGKTELLTWRFLALLATVQVPESILAITFTRKAAAEMRNRILGALRAAAGCPDPRENVQPLTVELARAALASDRRCGWDLLGNPGRLRIQTIDALNLGLARRLPVLSGLGGGLGVEEDAHELYRLAAERLLEHLPDGHPLHAAAVATLLEHVDNRVPRFVSLVIEMLARRESWGPDLPAVSGEADDDARLRNRLESARTQLVRAHLAALEREFPRDLLQEAVVVGREAAEGLVAAGLDSPLTALAGCSGLPGDSPGDAPLWLALATLLVTEGEGTLRRSFTYKLGMPAGPQGKSIKARARALTDSLGAERHEDLVERLHATRRLPAPHYADDEWQVLRAQLVVLRLAAAELEVVFAERRAADYPRFAQAALQALGTEDAPTDTALALDASLNHVLVDEFQDTSRAQVDLLEGLTAGWLRGDGRTLFLVGDPMQSIYRFRNAEVGLFLDVKREGIGGVALEPLTLALNFRSTGPVVEWVNDCFSRILPAYDDETTGAVSYSPGSAHQEGTDGGVRVHALFRRSRRQEAVEVVDVVERRLGELRPKDGDPPSVAILVQGRSHLVHIVAELARRGVRFQATDIDPLGERPIVLDLLALTRAIAHAADRPAWLTVLRAPWCGLTLAELHALCGDEPYATLAELLRDDARRARLYGDARQRLERTWDILAQVPSELRRFGLRDAVERAWLALGGPASAQSLRELDEAQAYLDQLAELGRDAAGPMDLARLAEALEELYAPSRPDPSVHVELLTVHKAKGLQFDTVIVPGLERRLRGDSKRLLQWVRVAPKDARSLVVAPVAGTGADPNALYRWLEDIESGKFRQEKRRLLYVAATRAKRWLHLFGTCAIKEQEEGGVGLVRPADSVALGMLWPVVGPEFEAQLAVAGGSEGEEAPAIARDPPLRQLPAEWRPPEVPCPRVRSRVTTRPAAVPAVEFDWATETARHVGTVVHRELQRVARIGLAKTGDPRVERRRWADELAELGVPTERREAAADRVEEAIRRTLRDERGRWLLDPGHAAAESELALSGPVDGEVISVVIDRTFVDRAGTRWVVDYKTSSHEGADLDGFLASEQARYRPQLERYAAFMRRLGPEPVRLGLYFPLLSAWREWS